MAEAQEKLFIDMELPNEVIWLSDVFNKAGAELYVVGGAVRDAVARIFHGHDNYTEDHDLVTNLKPDEVIRLLETKKGLPGSPSISFKEVGKAFGIVLVQLNDQQYEIATFREDSKTSDGRRPDYVTFSTIDKDAERRDLTINALYYDLASRAVLDFVGGLNDIRGNYIRFVGEAKERIYEDKLRVMRFARFHNKVNGNVDAISKDTRKVIRACDLREKYSAISDERIREEFLKGANPGTKLIDYLVILEDLGLLKQVFPGMETTTNIKHSMLSVEGIVAQILRRNEPKFVREQLLRIKWTKEEVESISFLIGVPDFTAEQIVDFKIKRSRTDLSDAEIVCYAIAYCNNNGNNEGMKLIIDMLNFEYPSVVSFDVISQGFEGKALGVEIKRRETENFKVWCDGRKG